MARHEQHPPKHHLSPPHLTDSPPSPRHPPSSPAPLGAPWAPATRCREPWPRCGSLQRPVPGRSCSPGAGSVAGPGQAAVSAPQPGSGGTGTGRGAGAMRDGRGHAWGAVRQAPSLAGRGRRAPPRAVSARSSAEVSVPGSLGVCPADFKGSPRSCRRGDGRQRGCGAGGAAGLGDGRLPVPDGRLPLVFFL